MFGFIAFNVILPIFIVMSLGFFLAKCFTLDLGTLSKLNFYIFIPVFMFYNLLIFKPDTREMTDTMLFSTFLFLATFPVMILLTRSLKFSPDLAVTSTLSVMIYNSANYGIPVMDLAFHGEGVALQVIIITIMNVLTYTLGILIVGGWMEWKKGLITILKLPILYALALVYLLRSLPLEMPQAILSPLKWTSEGMPPIALLTLGAQLGQGGISLKHARELWITVAARLLLGPLIAYGLIEAMGLHGLLARVLFVSSSFPTAVVTVLFGIEYNKEPTFAADVVFITTLLSSLTVTAAISFSQGSFG